MNLAPEVPLKKSHVFVEIIASMDPCQVYGSLNKTGLLLRKFVRNCVGNALGKLRACTCNEAYT